MIMARAATVRALRNRGISKKTAELLADAGFTLEKLAASKIERLAKFIPKKEAENVLKKLGAARGRLRPLLPRRGLRLRQGEIAKKIHGLKLSKKRLNEVLTKICEKF